MNKRESGEINVTTFVHNPVRTCRGINMLIDETNMSNEFEIFLGFV